jgi:hypothetical protein
MTLLSAQFTSCRLVVNCKEIGNKLWLSLQMCVEGLSKITETLNMIACLRAKAEASTSLIQSRKSNRSQPAYTVYFTVNTRYKILSKYFQQFRIGNMTGGDTT